VEGLNWSVWTLLVSLCHFLSLDAAIARKGTRRLCEILRYYRKISGNEPLGWSGEIEFLFLNLDFLFQSLNIFSILLPVYSFYPQSLQNKKSFKKGLIYWETWRVRNRIAKDGHRFGTSVRNAEPE
jgi:hypothetical protein